MNGGFDKVDMNGDDGGHIKADKFFDAFDTTNTTSDLSFYSPDEIDKIIQILSGAVDKGSAFKKCSFDGVKCLQEEKLVQLVSVARDEDNTEVWLHHFNTILNILIEYLCHHEVLFVELSMKVLFELAHHHTDRFLEHFRLVFSSIAHVAFSTEDKVLSLKSQNTCYSLIRVLPLMQLTSPLLTTLTHFLTSDRLVIRYFAFRCQFKLVERAKESSVMVDLLPSIVPSLLRGYEDQESVIRKESLMTLVQIYQHAGEELKPWLKDLCRNKQCLLSLYIKKNLHKKRLKA